MSVFDTLRGKSPLTIRPKPVLDELDPFAIAGVEEDEVDEPDGDDREVQVDRDADS